MTHTLQATWATAHENHAALRVAALIGTLWPLSRKELLLAAVLTDTTGIMPGERRMLAFAHDVDKLLCWRHSPPEAVARFEVSELEQNIEAEAVHFGFYNFDLSAA